MTRKPKTGHWIYICDNDFIGLKVFECSKCGKRVYLTGRYKYCPNCGLKMVEPQESEG